MIIPKQTRKPKRQGQGHGSGKGGHTSGRGMKGQKARTGVSVLFEGYKVRKSLYKRLPLKRGKDKFKPKDKPFAIDITLLNFYKDGDTVSLETLGDKGIIVKGEVSRVKILGSGELTKKLTVDVPTSKSVAERIEKAGGTVIVHSTPRPSKFKKQVRN